MNRVDLVGRLVRDPELRHTPNGNAVVQFNIAIDRITNKDEEKKADFPPIVVWNKQAENLTKYCKKGSLISVEGELRTRNYDDKDGKKVYITEVLATRIGFLSSKKDDSNFQNLEEPPVSSNNNQISYKPEEIDNMPAFDNDVTIFDNDLPF